MEHFLPFLLCVFVAQKDKENGKMFVLKVKDLQTTLYAITMQLYFPNQMLCV